MIRELLDNFWITIADKDRYYDIRDKLDNYKNIISDKLGYSLINRNGVVKLEKIPYKASSWMGIRDFYHKREYIFFTALLMYLEGKEKREQFSLEALTNELKKILPMDVDWARYQNRLSNTRVLRYAEKMKIIIIEEFDDFKYKAKDTWENTQALFTNEGTSRYFMRNFNYDISDHKSVEDFEISESVSIASSIREGKDLFLAKRGLYRELFLTPAVYRIEDENLFRYIRRYHEYVKNDVEEFLDAKLHLHRNSAFVVSKSVKNSLCNIPNSSMISLIALQLNALIVDYLNEGELDIDENSVMVLSKAVFKELISQIMDDFSEGWSIEFRDMTLTKLEKELINYMVEAKMIRVREYDNSILLMPMVGKIIGQFSEEEEIEDNEDGGNIDDGEQVEGK